MPAASHKHATSPILESVQTPDDGSISTEEIAQHISNRGKTLRFKNTSLERAYLVFSEQYGLLQLRFVYVLLMVLVGLFGLSDLLIYPLGPALQIVGIRFFVVVPILIYAYRKSYRLTSGKPFYPLVVLTALVTALSAVMIMYIPYYAGLSGHYEALMLFIYGIGGFMGLRFRDAIIVLVIMMIFYIFTHMAIESSTNFIVNSSYRLFCAVIIGVSQSYMSEKQLRLVYLQRILLERHAHRDGLTGIANRRAFDLHGTRALQHSARENKALTVVILDADHFKQYNDNYGHLKGDHCLQQLARVISHSARRPMDMAARYGGEEFVLLLYDVNEEDAVRMMARLQKDIQSLALEHKYSLVSNYVTVSGGICTRQAGHMQPLSQMLAEADEALYKAKANGRNQFVHSSTAVFSSGHPA